MVKDLNINYKINLDDTSQANITYIGKAELNAGTNASSVWQIQKIDETSGLILNWAEGNDNFDNVWDDRLNLTYK